MDLTAFSLRGKLSVVTGGSAGIGLGIAQSLVQAGGRVLIVGRREDKLKEAVDQLGDMAEYQVSDLSVLDKIPTLVRMIESRYGGIDILVNNAGLHLKKWASETSDEEFLHILQTNLLTVFALTREVARGMTDRKSGSILLISSMTGLLGMDRVSAYGTSKTALIGLMRNLVTEYSAYNVRINCIAPGWIESDMFLKAIEGDPPRKDKIIRRIAMPGFGKPEDIGNAAVYLSSAAARYVTGVVLPVDGGAAVNI